MIVKVASSYEFSASNGTYGDGRAGPLGAFLVFNAGSTALNSAALSNILTPARIFEMDYNVAKTAVAYAAPGVSSSITALGMSTTKL